MSNNLFYNIINNQSIIDMNILDSWLGNRDNLNVIIVDRVNWNRLITHNTIVQFKGSKEYLHIPEDVNIFEFFDLIYQYFFFKYNGKIPLSHPIFSFIKDLKSFFYQIIIQGRSIIKFNGTNITKEQLINWIDLHKGSISIHFLEVYNHVRITKTEVKKIMESELFSPESFHDTLENIVCLLDYNTIKFEENKYNIDFYRKISFTAIGLHKYNEALTYGLKGIELYGDDYELLLYIGESHYYNNSEDDAYRLFEKAVSVNPNGHEAISYLCILDYPNTLFEGENGEICVNEVLSNKILKKALYSYNFLTDSYNLLNTIASLYYNLGNFEKAAFFFKKNHLIDPYNIEILHFFISSLERLGDHSPALLFLGDFLSTNTNNSYLWNKMGYLYHKSGQNCIGDQFLYIASFLDANQDNRITDIKDKNIIDQYLSTHDYFSLLRYLHVIKK